MACTNPISIPASVFFWCLASPLLFLLEKKKVGKKKILSWLVQTRYLFLRVFSFGPFSLAKEKYKSPPIHNDITKWGKMCGKFRKKR